MSSTTPIYLNTYTGVFQGLGFGGGATPNYWLNDYHPNTAGYTALGDYLAARISDPGSTIAVLGDSWTVLGLAQVKASLEAQFGHTITCLDGGVSGQNMQSMYDRARELIAGQSIRYCVLLSGLANDLSGGRSQADILTDARLFILACQSAGVIPVLIGVPNFNLKSTEATALHNAFVALYGAA